MPAPKTKQAISFSKQVETDNGLSPLEQVHFLLQQEPILADVLGIVKICSPANVNHPVLRGC